MTNIRNALLELLVDIERDLRLYDLAMAPGPHEPGCECPRAACTLARLTPIDDLEVYEAVKDVGLDSNGGQGGS